MALIANIPALFLLAHYCASRGIKSTLLTHSAFIVFSIHYPLIVVMRKGCAYYFAQENDGVQFLLYLGSVITVTVLSLLFYQLLPVALKNLSSGHRS